MTPKALEPVELTTLEQFIAKVISLYHTTRLSEVPAEVHVAHKIRPWLDREGFSITRAQPLPDIEKVAKR